MNSIRIGAGAGFSGDRIDPAVELAEKGALDFLVFECLAERTIAIAQQSKLRDPNAGYDPLLEARLRAVLPTCRRQGIRIVTNMGAANPVAAAQCAQRIARELGLANIKIAAVTGDDVLEEILTNPYSLEETGDPVASLGEKIVSANAYLGVGPIVRALEAGADVVITGRTADPALFLAPMVYTFGWKMDDWQRLGRGTLAGHLLECAGQVTGGYFADPGCKDVPDLARLGFPIGEIDAEGNLIVTKVAGSGGAVTVATCKEQLLYEVHDPSAYTQPDVIADFSNVRLTEGGPDRVQVSGGAGQPRSGALKVSIGYRCGFVGEGQISYAGPGAVARGRLALSIVEERLRLIGVESSETRGDLIGVDSIFRSGDLSGLPEAPEVRLRFTGRTETMTDAMRIGAEVEALYLNGPAGGGGAAKSAREVIAVASTMMSEARVNPDIQIWET